MGTDIFKLIIESEIELKNRSISEEIKMSSEKQKVETKYQSGMDINAYVEQLLQSNISNKRKKWINIFKKCVLPKEIKLQIDEAIFCTLNSDTFLKDWGFEEEFEKGLTNAILLWGPPGTGKTMLAESIAAIIGQELLKIDTGDIQSCEPGEAERNIEKIFSSAKERNTMLLFDECDSLLYSREHVGPIYGAMINKLLVCIENHPGVVVLTTNMIDRLDPALNRRIPSKIKLDFPTEEAREEIWENITPKDMPMAKDVCFKKLSKVSLSGAEIKNALILAARKAMMAKEQKVTMGHLVDSVDNILQQKSQFSGQKESMRRRYGW